MADITADPDLPLTVNIYDREQVVILANVRPGLAVLLPDTPWDLATPTVDWTPVQRAVWVARLRAIADSIEEQGTVRA